jgi:hypothetical protein
MFNELVDFVEVELAWWHLAWEGKEQREKYKMPWWAVGWWRVRTWRCPQAGLDNLAWQMNLTNKDWASEDNPEYSKPSLQAINAREIHELYKWWTEQRPQRPDPYKVSGWSDYCDSKRRKSDDIFDDLENDDKIDTKPMLDHIHKLEEDYEREDEEMMIRLIKIRRALWT